MTDADGIQEDFTMYVTKLCYVLERLHFVESANTRGPIKQLEPVLTTATGRNPYKQQMTLDIEEYPVSDRAFEQLLNTQLRDSLRALEGGVPHVNVVSFDAIGPNASATVEVYWNAGVRTDQ